MRTDSTPAPCPEPHLPHLMYRPLNGVPHLRPGFRRRTGRLRGLLLRAVGLALPHDRRAQPVPGHLPRLLRRAARGAPGAGTPQHGLSSNNMALITSDCDAMRTHGRQMALITSGCGAMRTHGRQMALITSECVPFRSGRRRPCSRSPTRPASSGSHSRPSGCAPPPHVPPSFEVMSREERMGLAHARLFF